MAYGQTGKMMLQLFLWNNLYYLTYIVQYKLSPRMFVFQSWLDLRFISHVL